MFGVTGGPVVAVRRAGVKLWRHPMMRLHPQRILVLIVFAVQALSICAMARGVFLCVHPDGHQRIESVAGLAACASEVPVVETSEPSVSARTCIDVPLLAHDAAQPKSPRFVGFDIAPFDVALPSSLVTLAEPRCGQMADRHAERGLTPPELEQRSLRSVVLVI